MNVYISFYPVAVSCEDNQTSPPDDDFPDRDQEGSSISFLALASSRVSFTTKDESPPTSPSSEHPKDEVPSQAEFSPDTMAAGRRKVEEHLDGGKATEEPSKEGAEENNSMASPSKPDESDKNSRQMTEHYLTTSESDQEATPKEANPQETFSTSHSSLDSITETPPDLDTPENMVSSQLPPSSPPPLSTSSLGKRTKESEGKKPAILSSSSPEEDNEVVLDRVLRSAVKKTRNLASAGGVVSRNRTRVRSLVVSVNLKLLKRPVKGELIWWSGFISEVLYRNRTDLSVQP